MQNRFKFRLYDKAIGEMVYDVCVGFIKDSGKTDDWVCADTSCGQITYRGDRLKDIVLMQCTGLKDKNDKLIYEGDIVKYFCPAEYCSDGLHKCPECYSGENGSVHYDEDLAMYEYRSKSDECPLTDNINTEEDLEIIGNIYENPELLERNNDR